MLLETKDKYTIFFDDFFDIFNFKYTRTCQRKKKNLNNEQIILTLSNEKL